MESCDEGKSKAMKANLYRARLQEKPEFYKHKAHFRSLSLLLINTVAKHLMKKSIYLTKVVY